MHESSENSLAINGGPLSIRTPLPNWPPIDDSIRQKLNEVLASGQWGDYEGPCIEELKSGLQSLFRRAFAWPCCSGTYAVELALRGLQIDSGEVLLAGYDFPGNFRAVEAVGALPVLVDIQKDDWTLDVDQLAAAITAKTRAVIVSHLHGSIAAMSSVVALAADRAIAVIEDACQVPGGKLDGRPLGGFGDVSVCSFGGSKILTAGRGGAVMSDDPLVMQRIRIYCERGNNAFPLSQLQAAALLPQLDDLARRNLQRKASVEKIIEAATGFEHLQFPQSTTAAPVGQPVYYKLPLLAATERRDFVITALTAEGLPVGAGFRGFARRAPKRCRIANSIEHSESAAATTVLIHHAALLGDDSLVEQVIHALSKVDKTIGNLR